MITIHYVTRADKGFWYNLDPHLPENEFDKKVRDLQGYVLFEDAVPKGILRYNLFWDVIPFCTFIFVERSAQKQGYGRKLMDYWENEMRDKGYGMVMTSTQVDEDAQHFYLKMGYKECGGFIIDVPDTNSRWKWL